MIVKKEKNVKNCVESPERLSRFGLTNSSAHLVHVYICSVGGWWGRYCLSIRSVLCFPTKGFLLRRAAKKLSYAIAHTLLVGSCTDRRRLGPKELGGKRVAYH